MLFFFQSSGERRLRRSASASRRDSKDSKFREKISELEDIIRHQTKEFEKTNQQLVRPIFCDFLTGHFQTKSTGRH